MDGRKRKVGQRGKRNLTVSVGRGVREDRRITSIHSPGSTYNLLRNLLLKRPARFCTVPFKITPRHSSRETLIDRLYHVRATHPIFPDCSRLRLFLGNKKRRRRYNQIFFKIQIYAIIIYIYTYNIFHEKSSFVTRKD